MLNDIVLQVLQVLAVLLLAPLLQGFILKAEERVQRSTGPSIFQPYRDLWKLFHKQPVVPESASWVYFAAPIVAFTAMLIVPILIPVLTDRPLPISDMADMLGGGMVLTLRILRDHAGRIRQWKRMGGIGSSRSAMLGILAEPILILVLVGISLLARAMLPFVVNHTLTRQTRCLLESDPCFPGAGIFFIVVGRDRPTTHSFQHSYRDLHDRRSAHPRVFRPITRDSKVGFDDEAVHSVHHLLQCFSFFPGPWHNVAPFWVKPDPCCLCC